MQSVTFGLRGVRWIEVLMTFHTSNTFFLEQADDPVTPTGFSGFHPKTLRGSGTLTCYLTLVSDPESYRDNPPEENSEPEAL